ncbi:MAG: hypothetical protein GXP59_04445 [Deltaproteobacteria bacterium]|nr:hypothetical protein [Deltaproteobacteria bacterium]
MIRLFTIIILAAWTFTAGCSSHVYIRHLASDACLVTPQQSTKKDVLNYMGPPDNRLTGPNGEEWIYYQRHQSSLRKLPYVGDKMGDESYEAMIVTFNGNRVKTCVYRAYNEREFKNSKLKTNKSKSVDKK